MELKTIVLNHGKDKSLRRKHPWVFSGAINKIISDNGEAPEIGELVEIVDSKNNFLAQGFFSEGTIAVRVISFKQEEINQEFWNNKIRSSFNVRNGIGLTKNNTTNIYRLMHAEGDGIPGLIIDFYNGTAVIQAHDIGVYNNIKYVTEALKAVYGSELLAIYNKSAESLLKQVGVEVENEYLYKNEEPSLVGIENDCKYNLDWINGQKTGFFIDQRENRNLIGEYSKGKKVLNTFCYSGGFSVSALKSGAIEVHSVDSSQKAVDLANANVELNSLSGKHEAFTSDTLDYLKENSVDYDIIVLDPSGIR